jgi:leader peptidase (prepilin peptidase)/N-methyltransferase
MTVIAIMAGTLGAIIGSFLNVVAYRVPAGRSLIAPSSSCGSCGHAIRARDNVPLLSWVLLKGRCRDCAAPISVRYPLVEAGTGVLFVLLAFKFGVPSGTTATIAAWGFAVLAFAYLASTSVALGLIDADTRRLPNRIVLPTYAVGAMLLTLSSVFSGDLVPLLRAAIGMLALFLLYLAIALISNGMGMGDVKLAGALGLYLGWLGWDVLAVGAVGGFILGGLFGTVLLLTRRVKRGSSLPFGPWMLAGAWLGILGGTPIATAYLRFSGLN